MFSGLATNIFFAILRASVLISLYDGQQSFNGLSVSGAVTYIIVSQGMIAFLMIFGSWEIMNSVYTGSIGADLLKPIPLFFHWMARDLGRSLVNLVLRGLLLLGVLSLFYPIVTPRTVEQWLALPLVLALGWLISYALRFLVNLAAFWTPDARGIGRMTFMVMNLMSGFFMPLRLFPDWFVDLCHWTPFPALINTTIEVYLGVLSGRELWMAVANQVFWVAVLSLLAYLVLSAGVRKLVIQGG